MNWWKNGISIFVSLLEVVKVLFFFSPSWWNKAVLHSLLVNHYKCDACQKRIPWCTSNGTYGKKYFKCEQCDK